MPIVSTPKGYVVLDGAGGFVAGPFATPQEASQTVMQQATVPVTPPRRHIPVAIPNGSGSYSVTAGDGTGRAIDGPFETKAEAARKAAGLSLVELMKPAPDSLRRLADVIAGHQPYNRMSITEGYRSPDVEDGRMAPAPKKP